MRRGIHSLSAALILVWAAPDALASESDALSMALQEETAEESSESGDSEDSSEEDWKKVGEEEEESQWVKVEEPEEEEPIELPSVNLKRVGGLTTAGVGVALLIRGFLLRSELRSEVETFIEEVDPAWTLADGWSSQITDMQQKTNLYMTSGLALGLAGGGLLAYSAPSEETSSMKVTFGWGWQW